MSRNNEENNYHFSTTTAILVSIQHLIFLAIGAIIYTNCPKDAGGMDAIMLLCCPQLYVVYKVITQNPGSKWPALCKGAGSKPYPVWIYFVGCCCCCCCCCAPFALLGISPFTGNGGGNGGGNEGGN